MEITKKGAGFPTPPEPLALRAEALLRRQRERREEEVRREQRAIAIEWDRRAAAFTAAEQPFHVAHDLRVSADAARALAAILEGK